MCWRVIKYIFKYLFYIGIGLIKKGNKNQMKLEEDFFKLAINRQKNNIIELYEDDDDCIIAKDKDTLVFVEVKTRSTTNCGLPIEAINEKKLFQINT